MIKILIVIVGIFSFSNYFSQKQFVVSGDIFGRRVFIKNNGQFDKTLPNAKHIEYAYLNGTEQVYFNSNGLTYLLEEQKTLTENQRETIEKGKKIKPIKRKKCTIDVTWLNSNTNIQIIESDKQNHYQSFGDAKYKSNCYKKITYKNVYNKIDIEYVFTNEKDNGIKYNVILYPGANIEDIKIKYTGDVKKLLLKDGNIIIKNAVHDFTELSPKSFQNGKLLKSLFTLNDNIISFNLPNGYDKLQTLIIDPWVVNLSLTSNDYGFDVDYDYAGNYYVFGGSGPFLISKYSSTGALIWTFAGVVPSISWTSLGSTPSFNYCGGFLVDKITGKVYESEGFNMATGARMVRINSLGIYDMFVSTAVLDWREIWDLGYYCLDGSVFGLGGTTEDNTSAGKLNTTTGIITPLNFSGDFDPGQDVASHAIDKTGRVFLLFASASSTITNHIMRTNSTFTFNDWISPTSYATLNESDNKKYIGTGITASFGYSNGYNALAVNTNYLYYYDGLNLAAYDKTTGAKLGSTTTSLNELEQGGIAVDECNNIYVGGNGSILCYNFNGTTFNSTGSIPLATSTTNKYVTDILYFEQTNELFVSGSGFGGKYLAINSGTCSSINNFSLAVIPPCTGGNNNNTAVATITTSISSPVITYSWTNSSGSIVSSTVTSATSNTVTGLTDGVYTLIVQIDAPCGPIQTQTINVSSSIAISVNSGTICSGQTFTINPSGAVSYTYTGGSAVVSPSTTSTYTVTGTSTGTNGCVGTGIAISTVTVFASPVADFTGISNGNIYFINTSLNVLNTSSNYSAFNWVLCDGIISTSTSIAIPLIKEEECCIKLIATNANCKDSLTKCYKVEQEFSIVIPNVFTPNGDNSNEIFKIPNVGLKDMNCIIYDRWGLKMYEWVGTTGFWDGNAKSGKPAPTGTYFFILNYTKMDNTAKTEKGFITLFRD